MQLINFLTKNKEKVLETFLVERELLVYGEYCPLEKLWFPSETVYLNKAEDERPINHPAKYEEV